MCDRTKTEILARTLAYTFFKGMKMGDPTLPKNYVIDNTEKYWKNWVEVARSDLEVLEKHNDE